MDYIFQLEQERSRAQMDRIANAVGQNAAEFKKLIDILYNGHPALQKRASWAIEIIARDKPELIKPHIKLFIAALNRFESDSLKRGFLVALSKQKIPKKLQAKMLDTCFELMLSPDRPVAVKVFAMEVAKNIVLEHPDLKGELKLVIDDQIEKNSVAFRARARMVLKKMSSR